MKKIVPFNNVLTFNTDVYEIDAISLEHDIKKDVDAISGVFYISGEYRMTVGSLEKDKFNFELPFDIALGNNYDLTTLVVDIDDFRYELLDNNKLKVNIDLYIDGEIKEENDEIFTDEEFRELKAAEENYEEVEKVDENNHPDLLDEMLVNEEEKVTEKIDNQNNNENNNIFSGFNEEEKYVTYRVYPVMENDTLDKILEKYQVTKEELAQYNGNLDIHTGDKLIIPATKNDK